MTDCEIRPSTPRKKPEGEGLSILDLEVYDCPECLNHGTLLRIDGDGRRIGRDCRCMAVRRNIMRLRRSGLQDMIRRYTFASYQTPERWQAAAKEIAIEYAEQPRDWFIAAGSVGAGKTHLCTAICSKLLQRGIDTRYMLWKDVSTVAKAEITNRAEYTAIVEPLKRVRALYIDDLFKVGKSGEIKSADVSLAFEILNARYIDRSKLTIISTELDFDDLLNLDVALGSRIHERTEGRRVIFDSRPNWRMQGRW